MSTSGKPKDIPDQQVLSDEEIKSQAREVLYKNMISGRKAGYDYHCTKLSPGTYPFQYFWDICFHVFTLNAFGEVDMAKKHLRSLFAMQRPDGCVGRYWKGTCSRMMDSGSPIRSHRLPLMNRLSSRMRPYASGGALPG